MRNNLNEDPALLSLETSLANNNSYAELSHILKMLAYYVTRLRPSSFTLCVRTNNRFARQYASPFAANRTWRIQTLLSQNSGALTSTITIFLRPRLNLDLANTKCHVTYLYLSSRFFAKLLRFNKITSQQSPSQRTLSLEKKHIVPSIYFTKAGDYGSRLFAFSVCTIGFKSHKGVSICLSEMNSSCPKCV